MNDEQFVLCDQNFFELEVPSPQKVLENNFEQYGKADLAQVFVFKQAELMKLKGVMEREAARIIDTAKSPWDAIDSYRHLLALDADNPGDLRVEKNTAPLYNVSNSGNTITRFFENIMRVITLDRQNVYLQETNELLTDVFCKISVGSLARTYPQLETAWSFEQKRKYAKAFVKPLADKEKYDEIFKGVFGLSTRSLP